MDKASTLGKITNHLKEITIFVTALAGLATAIEGTGITDFIPDHNKKDIGNYVILDSAYEQKTGAQKRISQLVAEGYNNKANFLWIPDFDCMSGKEMYQVYVGPYEMKDLKAELCAFMEKYQKRTYGLFLCKPGEHRNKIVCDLPGYDIPPLSGTNN